jgi:hypothetical protein
VNVTNDVMNYLFSNVELNSVFFIIIGCLC